LVNIRFGQIFLELNDYLKRWNAERTFLLGIFLVALLLRLIPVVVLRNMGIGLDDMFQYDMLARSIASGKGYRWYAASDLPTVLPYLKLDLTSVNYDPRGVLTTFRPPLYPSFLALIYLIFGMGVNRFFSVRLIQVVLAASLSPLTYAIALHFFPEKQRNARISAWIVTLYPFLVVYPLSLATENLFFVLVLLAILALLKAKESLENLHMGKTKKYSIFYRSRWFVIAGIILGLTCLTRSVFQAFALLAVIWIFFFLRERFMAIIVLFSAAIVVAPWVVRNSLVDGQFTGIESALGYDLYLGYNPNGTGTFQYPQSLDLMSIINDAQRNSVGIQDTIGFIRADPDRVPYLIIRKAGYFFGLERRALSYFYSNNYFGHISSPILAGIFAVFCLPFIVISLSGLAGLSFISLNKEIWLMILFFIGYISPHLLIISEDRFHLVIVPFLAILSAQFWSSGLLSVFQKLIKSRSGKVAFILVAFAILLFLINWGFELWRDAGKLALLFGPYGNQTYFSY
jgi:hypothetical protein